MKLFSSLRSYTSVQLLLCYSLRSFLTPSIPFFLSLRSPLASPADDDASQGGWVYRVSEVSLSGVESDLCQCLVEVQSQGEKIQGLVAGVGIVVVAVGAIIAGTALDPLQ